MSLTSRECTISTTRSRTSLVETQTDLKSLDVRSLKRKRKLRFSLLTYFRSDEYEKPLYDIYNVLSSNEILRNIFIELMPERFMSRLIVSKKLVTTFLA